MTPRPSPRVILRGRVASAAAERAGAREVLFSIAVPAHRVGAMDPRGPPVEPEAPRGTVPGSRSREGGRASFPELPALSLGPRRANQGRASRVWGRSLFPKPRAQDQQLNLLSMAPGGEQTLCPSHRRQRWCPTQAQGQVRAGASTPGSGCGIARANGLLSWRGSFRINAA